MGPPPSTKWDEAHAQGSDYGSGMSGVARTMTHVVLLCSSLPEREAEERSDGRGPMSTPMAGHASPFPTHVTLTLSPESRPIPSTPLPPLPPSAFLPLTRPPVLPFATTGPCAHFSTSPINLPGTIPCAPRRTATRQWQSSPWKKLQEDLPRRLHSGICRRVAASLPSLPPPSSIAEDASSSLARWLIACYTGPTSSVLVPYQHSFPIHIWTSAYQEISDLSQIMQLRGLLNVTVQKARRRIIDICSRPWNDSCRSSSNARLCIIQDISTWMCSIFMDVLPILIETNKQSGDGGSSVLGRGRGREERRLGWLFRMLRRMI
ncbi:uncharacterized protein LOC123396520 [Hordeum vulgare subsp. vulgare]|uniref:uncharacterized protein LOC123396520 n=1 Tax=Hordeum vulgare subsp. vulgare TaxID=112509 RepID=UPI001D1A59C7|nr:uncharacterized protein LOC123396520 [Hordeum vulgare subsp. vulgare]